MTKVDWNDEEWQEFEDETDAIVEELEAYFEDEGWEEDYICPGYIHPCGNSVRGGEQLYCPDCAADRQADYDRQNPPLPDMPLP